MVKFMFRKGPGRFDFAVAYIRGSQGDFAQCVIGLDDFNFPRPISVLVDIQKAVPIIPEADPGNRNTWEISGLMFPSAPSRSPQRLWLPFTGSYGFTSPPGYLGIGEIDLDISYLKSLQGWKDELAQASRRIRVVP